MRDRKRSTRSGFTLIELLVSVAIIALLISILLPSLSGARKQARAIKCAANLRDVGLAFAGYLGDSRGVYPPSYVYPYNDLGDWEPAKQEAGHPYGYNHWSWFLYNRGTVKEGLFTCPEMEKGGDPRTNPGPDSADWEGGQQDQTGSGPPGVVIDKQARRMAYTANAAIVPRNKFTAILSGNPDRKNTCVNDSWIKGGRGVILVTEFSRNWKAAAVMEGGSLLSKSHRPVSAFWNIGSDTDEYKSSLGGGFQYGHPGVVNYGLQPASALEDQYGVIDGSMGPEVNVVGRHHPGGDALGGTANFLYVDGSVARKTILETMRKREWGQAYYSLTGGNTEVLPGQ
jgi:prepilin-type N-terminal cleavage/methylation domain-containing protein/prepilin-type processing-associated H-X9-DG protein